MRFGHHEIHSRRLLLRPRDIPPTRDDFEVIGVFNPGAALYRDEVVLLVRVAEQPRERRNGFTPLPRWTVESGIVIDWVPNDEIEPIDTRVVRRKSDGIIRLTFISHLQVIYCGDGGSVVSTSGAAFSAQSELEEFGVEDPRLTPLDGRYYFTYVAVSSHGVATALASTADFQTFERHGLIFCLENKDVVLFPQRIGGSYVALHRPNGATRFARPEMWLAKSSDLIHWGQHAWLASGQAEWESGRIGAGPPPIWTDAGWLTIYHGNVLERHRGEVGSYSAGAMLLDLEQPSRILWRSSTPILEPTADFERQGFVPGVIFPTGAVEKSGKLLVYYGAADTYTAVAEVIFM